MKGLIFSGKWLKFLAWPGLALMTAGLVAGSLTGWQPLPLGLLIVGVGLLLLGLSFSGTTAGAFWQQRSTQVGTNAIISVVAVLVILGLLNFLAVQFSSRLDLTETQLFTLAPASKQVAQELDEPVRIVIFDPVRSPGDVQLLESYRRLNNQFSYDYIDPYANPLEAQAFGANQPGMVFLEVGEERRFLQSIGGADNPENLGAPDGLSERQITNALDQIIRDRSLTVYFVQGHGEYVIDGSEAGLSQAATSLEDKNYVVNPLNLAETQTIPDDASVLVIAGPDQDFFEAEVEALEAYLAEGGGVLLLLDPRTDGGLGTLLDDWGVALDDRIVLDTSGAGQFVGLGEAAPIVSEYGDHPITQEFGNGRSFFPLARPIETQEIPDVNSTPLLFTNPQSLAETVSDEGTLSFDPEAPSEGPYVLGAALSRSVEGETPEGDAEGAATEEAPEGDTEGAAAEEAPEDAEGVAAEEAPENDAEGAAAEEAPENDAEGAAVEEAPENDAEGAAAEEAPETLEARIVVIGNSGFATDGVFDQQLNGDIFLNAISWLGQEGDATLSIRPKSVTDRRIQMTAQQAWGLGIFSLLILPLTGLALAILMALRRR